MPQLSPAAPEDFRRVLREKAHAHSMFYHKLGGASAGPPAPAAIDRTRELGLSESLRAQPTQRVRRARDPQASARVSALVRHFEPAAPPTMQYLRPPRVASPASDESGDICSSDDDDRAAVRRRSREFSDDSAVELEPRPRRASRPRGSPPRELPRRQLTLVEAHDVELGGAEPRGRCVRTPSVVVSDYSEDVSVGATPEEAAWLRARALSADSACSSCSTLSSREDDDLDVSSPSPSPSAADALHKKMISVD